MDSATTRMLASVTHVRVSVSAVARMCTPRVAGVCAAASCHRVVTGGVVSRSVVLASLARRSLCASDAAREPGGGSELLEREAARHLGYGEPRSGRSLDERVNST